MKRSLLPTLLLVVLAGCPHPRAGTTPSVGTPGAKPGADLDAAGQSGATGGSDATGDDHRLDDGAPKVTDLDVIHLDVVGHDANGDPIFESKTPGPYLDAGNKAFSAGKLDEAVIWYGRLAKEFPDSGLAPSALYNIALVAEKKGDQKAALLAYADLYAAYPDAAEAAEGLLRSAAIEADRDRFKESEALLRTLDGRDDLTREVRIEVQARLGYVVLEQDRVEDAEIALQAAVATWRKASHIEDPYYIAMANFYLGQVASRRFAAQPVRSADEDLSADMRTKRKLLLDAYDAWKEALGFKNAYWATAAGYEMSQIFYEYWKAAVAAPFPDGMKAEARPLYVTEVRARVRENLEKALEGHQANVGLAEAYGVQTSWSEASKDRAVVIMVLLDRVARAAAP
jgi:tetratricopeptide (TPR) repeat protein